MLYSRFRHYRPSKSRKSSREGEIHKSPRQRRPLPIAGDTRSLLRPLSLSFLKRPPVKPVNWTPPGVYGRARIEDRLPLLGLRSQRGNNYNLGRNPLEDLRSVMGALDSSQKQPIRGSICQRRGARRRVLFMNKIAGTGKKKSPGAGGSYRKNNDSQTSCRVR